MTGSTLATLKRGNLLGLNFCSRAFAGRSGHLIFGFVYAPVFQFLKPHRPRPRFTGVPRTWGHPRPRGPAIGTMATISNDAQQAIA